MPKMVEVDETELLNSRGVVATVQAMMRNPESRRRVLEAQKIVNPDAVIPELDAAKPYVAELKTIGESVSALNKRLDDEAAAREAEKRTNAFASAWEEQKANLRAQGYSDEGIAKIEEHAKTEGIPSLRAAAADFDRLHPPAAPVSPGGYNTWDFFKAPADDDTDMKKLLESRGEDEGLIRNMVDKTLVDIRGGARR